MYVKSRESYAQRSEGIGNAGKRDAMRLFRTRQFYVTFKGHVYPFSRGKGSALLDAIIKYTYIKLYNGKNLFKTPLLSLPATTFADGKNMKMCRYARFTYIASPITR